MANTLKDKLASIYDRLRHICFTIIYPARKIHNPRTRNFIGLQQYKQLVLEDKNIAHPMVFDFKGNVHAGPITRVQKIEPKVFDAILIAQTTRAKIYDSSKQYIIIVGGNTTCYETFIPEMIRFNRKSSNRSYVLGVNPPGIGMSPGRTRGPQDYHAALRSIVDHLHKKGVPHENIVILGHSFGAAIGASVVAECHAEGKKIRLIADRTLATVAGIVGNTIRRAVPTVFLRSTLGALLGFICRRLIIFLGLEINVAEHFTTINTLTPGAARGLNATEDEMIPEESSLFFGLNAQMQIEYCQKFKLHNAVVSASHSVCRESLRAINTDDEVTAEDFITNCLDEFAQHLPGPRKEIIFTACKLTRSTSNLELASPAKYTLSHN